MAVKDDKLLQALKFVACDTDKICRLCFASTDQESASLDDTINFQQPYIEENITLADMFLALDVPTEPFLPLYLCVNCTSMTIYSYLFKKLCQHSIQKWTEAFNKLNQNLNQSDSIGSTIKTFFLMINNKENLIYTSKKQYGGLNKKAALIKVKTIKKSRETYNKVKKKDCNITCDECGQRFHSNYNLMKHMTVHGKSKYSCPDCPKEFSLKQHLKEHAERVHYPKKFQCAKCAKMFGTERMLSYHEKSHHVAVACKICSVQFPSKMLLKAHQGTHEIFRCEDCDKTFKSKSTYKMHLKICGDNEDNTPKVFCDICNKGYLRKNGLRTHLKTQHGFGNVLACNWCGKRYDAQSRLRNHIVKHTRERNFTCNQCGNKFVTQAALVYHTRLHTGEKPYKCTLCSERFLSSSRRMEHIRRKHYGPTEPCPICNCLFMAGHQLKRHIRRHKDPKSKLFVPVPNKSVSQELNNEKLTVDIIIKESENT